MFSLLLWGGEKGDKEGKSAPMPQLPNEPREDLRMI